MCQPPTGNGHAAHFRILHFAFCISHSALSVPRFRRNPTRRPEQNTMIPIPLIRPIPRPQRQPRAVCAHLRFELFRAILSYFELF